MSFIGGQTVWPQELKFGIKNHINPPRGYRVPFALGFDTPTPGALNQIPSVCPAQTVCFCENFMKQKLQGTLENGGTVQLEAWEVTE